MRYPTALLISALALPAIAGHYSGANITYSCDGTGQYTVTLQLFVDCSGAPIIPQDILFSSACGTSFTAEDLPATEGIEVSQLCEAQIGNSTCNGGPLPGMRLYEFTTVQNLASCEVWNISWNICCRANSLNLAGVPGMYVETSVHRPDGLCETSPIFTEDALPYVCVNQPVTYNFGVSDAEGDSLVYTFINARTWVGNEQAPVNYQPGSSGIEPIPGITLDAATGQVSFTPLITGYYIVAVEVAAYSAGELTSSVVRDILFVVIDCANTNPDANSGTIQNLTGNATLAGDYALQACVAPAFCFNVTVNDADDLQSLALTSNVAQVLAGASFEVNGTNPATATVCWDGQGASTGTFVFTINATDDACPQPASQFFSYTITISDGPDAGQDDSIAVCPNGGPVIMFDSLMGTPFPGGTWTSPQGNPHPPSFDPGIDPTGVYCYTIADTTSCPDATACLTISLLNEADPACLGTGISVAYPPAAILIRPDPNHGQFRVHLAESTSRLDVLDLSGRVVFSLPVGASSMGVGVDLPSSLNAGRYVLRLVSENSTRQSPFTLVR